MLPNDISRLRPAIDARYWAKVATGDIGQCWPWTAYRDAFGYGKLGTPDGVAYAHRVGWTLVYGPIPDGLRVLHSCDWPPCQNPVHWFLGTQGANIQDMWDKGRHPFPNAEGRIFLTGDAHWTRAKPDLVMRGESHPKAKLTERIVILARQLVASRKRTIASLAREYGVKPPVMRRAVNGQNWKHVA